MLRELMHGIHPSAYSPNALNKVESLSPTLPSFLLQKKNAIVKQFTWFHFQTSHLYQAGRVISEYFLSFLLIWL